MAIIVNICDDLLGCVVRGLLSWGHAFIFIIVDIFNNVVLAVKGGFLGHSVVDELLVVEDVFNIQRFFLTNG